MKYAPLLFLLSVLLAPPGACQDITVFPLPLPEGAPVSLATGHDGHLWFKARDGASVYSLSTEGSVREYPLPHPECDTLGLTRGPRDSVWFVQRYDNSVAGVAPDGTVTEYRIPLPQHSGVTTPLSADADGSLWFAGYTYGAGSFVAQMTPDGEFRIQRFPTWGEVSSLAIDRDGLVWLARTSESLLSQVMRTGGTCDIPTYHPEQLIALSTGGVCVLPLDSDGVLFGVDSGVCSAVSIDGAPESPLDDPDGHLWFTAFVANAIVSLSPSGTRRTFPLPNLRAGVRTITVGPDGAIWAAGSRPPAAYRLSLRAKPRH